MPRLAFLSTAHIHTRSFLQSIADRADAECGAIWDDVAERGRDYAAQFAAPFVEDLDAVLADDRIDGFVICAENTRHLPLLEKVLPLGKPERQPTRLTRKPVAEFATWERFDGAAL